MNGLHDLIESHVRKISQTRAEQIERLILEGHNRIELPWRHPGEVEVLTVPAWRSRPRARAKIEWARLRFRRDRRLGLLPGKVREGDPLEGEDDRTLREVDVRGVAMTLDTATAWGRRRINEYDLLALPVASPVVLLYTDIVGTEHTVRLP